MASRYLEISSDDESPAVNDHGSTITTRPNLNITTPLFYPSFRYFFFFPPPIYYIVSGDSFLLPPPAIWVYYPLWSINPNPNYQHQSMQELSPIRSHARSPPVNSMRVFRGRGNKLTWRRKDVESNADHVTTVMIRNIPNRYTREMIIEFMDNYCEEANKMEKNEDFPTIAYDFLYLPMDFKTQRNKGYAFVNFTSKEVVQKFKVAREHKPWSHFQSRKVLEIVHAKIQGKDELVKHFEQMIYPVQAYSAVLFNPARSGSKNAVDPIMVGKCAGLMISV